MELEELVVPEEKVKEELEAFRELVRSEKKRLITKVHRDLKRVYGHMRHGGKIINVYESFKKAGLNADGDPKLAIARADGAECYCKKRRDGSAVFGIQRFDWKADFSDYTPRKAWGEVQLPPGTYNFPEGKFRSHIKCLVPILPVSILKNLRYTLKNYHIIWEVEKWERVPPKDPILVKLVNPAVALVLATWSLTDLERAVILGRL